MTHATMLAAGCFVLAVPGAIADTIKVLEIVRDKIKSVRGRRRMGFSDKHPILFAIFNFLMVASIAAGYWMVLHPPQVTFGAAPTSQAPAPQNPAPQVIPFNKPKHPSFVEAKPKVPEAAPSPASITQDGIGDRQTAVQAPITQSNSGGCNQQVVGGDNNTNVCGPLERHLSQMQKDGFIEFAKTLPSTCLVVFGSADSEEPMAYARELHDFWLTIGTTRDPGILFGWHPKGIYFQVKSSAEPCAPYALKLRDEMKAHGFPAGGVSERPELGSGSEIQVIVGEAGDIK